MVTLFTGWFLRLVDWLFGLSPLPFPLAFGAAKRQHTHKLLSP